MKHGLYTNWTNKKKKLGLFKFAAKSLSLDGKNFIAFGVLLSGARVGAAASGVPRNLFSGGGVQQIQLRTEDRENGDLGA